MKVVFSILLLLPLSVFSQFQGIYVKFESKKSPVKRIATIYISGQKNVVQQTVGIPTDYYFPFRLSECKLVQVIIDDFTTQSLFFPTSGFLCGDSVIVNMDNGYSKILNRNYPEYEQNYFFYRNEFFKKNKFNISTESWKDIHQWFGLEKKFIEESFMLKKISDSFYNSLITDLPYKVNNYLLRAPFIHTEVVKDSLVACNWYKDSLIDTENYIEFVTGYIHYFELPKLENGNDRDNAYFNYVYNKTSGQLREELCFQFFLSSFIPANTNYEKQFETFKKITSNKKLLNAIEERIKQYKAETGQ